MVALPFFVYQETGSTIASAVMVAAELLPRLLFGSIAGVYVDRWNRKNVMVMTSIAQGLVILPLFLVESGTSMWIVYLISFLQVTLAMFFGPAENALLPLLVREEELLPANSLNALNNNLARLIGPPIGGAILAMWGLPGVVLFDSITFVAAGLLILSIHHSEAKVDPQVGASGATGRARLWKEWLEGIDLVRKNRVVFILFLSVVLLNFGGIMIDPLSVPYILDIVGAGVDVFGWMMTVQAVGGILGGLLAARINRRISTVSMYGWSEVILGVILIARYNIPDLPVLFVTTLITGFPAALGMAALETLFQQKVPNSHLGRISGALNTTVGLTSLFGVLGISGLLGELLGVVPVLNIAAAITLLTGWIVLIFLPRD
jgi:MFS family permease